MMELVFLQKQEETRALSLTCEDVVKRQLSASQEKEPHSEPDLLPSWS